jgi:4-hydroxybenzoyl-CoA thioesterase
MAFTSQIRIRFGDEDHARIVYYPRFFDFFHRVFEDFFESEGKPYRHVLTVDKLGWPAVQASAEFKSPVRFGDDLVVELVVEKIGDKSVSFVYRGRVGTTPVVEGRTTVVCVAMDTFKGRSIPDDYRAMFERHLVPPG